MITYADPQAQTTGSVPGFVLASDGLGQVTLTAEIGSFGDPGAILRLDPHCLGHRDVTALTIDVSGLACVDSRLVVWMLAIARALPGIPVTIRASSRALTQLRMLRLDSVFALAA